MRTFTVLLTIGVCATGFGLGTISDKDTITKSNFNTVIRVLLERDAKLPQAKTLLKDLYVKFENAKNWKKFPKEINFSLHEFNQKKLMAINNAVVESSSLLIRGGPHYSDKVQYRTDFYRGALKVTPNRSGLMITNILPLDDYLAGTLAAEMNGSWEIEALKAQAVASRTYALYMVQHPKNAHFDLDSTTQDQVYAGVEKESDRVRKALKETEGLYLIYHGKPVKAYYHSRCGGMTETANSVWRFKGLPFKKRVSCPYCAKNPYPWTTIISKEDLFKALRLPIQKLALLSNFSAEKTPSGRVAALRLDINGNEKTVTSDELRNLLGYSRIKSANFDWKIEGNDITFEGVGNGHGVGMCQWGARHLAKQGKTFREILKHYYPEFEVINLPNTPPIS